MAVIPKQQVYKMWAADGTYLGVLQGVTSTFKRIQDINTIGPAKVEVSVSMKVDTPYEPVKAITTEDGKWITTEAGVGLTTEGEQPNFAVDKTKIMNGNYVEITEVSDYHPNGLLAFTGTVKKWKVNYGTDDDAKLYLIPSSYDMNNKLVKSGPTLAVQQLNASGSGIIMEDELTGTRLLYAYDFLLAGITNISSISVWLSLLNPGTSNFTARIVDFGLASAISGPFFTAADNPSNHVATSTPVTVTSTTPAEYNISFPTVYYFDPTHYYGILFTSSATSAVGGVIWYSSSDVTALGATYYNAPGSGGWNFGITDRDIYFKIYSIPPYTKATITDFEPSALLETIIDNYNGEGGVVTYTPSSIESTGITISTYTFQANTVAEGLDILLSLSPAGFYYTIDPGTNILTFKRVHTTADHTLIFKKHIQTLDLSASIENLKNDIYFTGGLVGATNLFLERTNTTSIASFGAQIDRITDVKVITSSVGSSIANNYLDKVDDEVYETEVSIVDGTTDITTYQLGETIGFKGFGTFPDSVIIPIVRISRDMDILDADLGVLPVRQSDIVQDSQDDILAIQTVANPTQPS